MLFEPIGGFTVARLHRHPFASAPRYAIRFAQHAPRGPQRDIGTSDPSLRQRCFRKREAPLHPRGRRKYFGSISPRRVSVWARSSIRGARTNPTIARHQAHPRHLDGSVPRSAPQIQHTYRSSFGRWRKIGSKPGARFTPDALRIEPVVIWRAAVQTATENQGDPFTRFGRAG